MATATCSKCAQPALKRQGVCQEHWNEYMRSYRDRAVDKKSRAEHFHGFEEGVKAVVSYLRRNFGDRALTGYQIAVAVEKAMITAESPELAARRRMLAAMGKP